MRQLLITNDFPPVSGGISRYLYGLWSALPPEDIIVVAPKTPGHEEFDKGQAFRFVRGHYAFNNFLEKPANIFVPLLLSIKLIAQEKIGYIHCGHILTSGTVGWLLNLFFGIPYCIYVYGSDVTEHRERITYSLIKRIVLRADKIVTECTYMEDILLGFGVEQDRIHKIIIGIDTENWDPEADPAAVKKKFDLEGKKVVLTLSRLVRRKGHDVVIRAMKNVPDAVYLIAGTGPERARLEKIAEEAGIEGRVRFAGFVPDEQLPEIYAACDVFILANRDIKGDVEGTAIVYMEAFASGKPVIGGRSGGTEDCVIDNVNGILVNPEDTAEIGRRIVELLSDRERRERLGAAGRKMVEERFSERIVRKRFKEIFAK